jgi:hypothetical protein
LQFLVRQPYNRVGKIMEKLRITALANGADDELRRLEMIKRDLYVRSAVEIDPENPAHQTVRDSNRRAYFEFSTSHRDEVERIVKEFGHEAFVKIESAVGPAGEPCVRCGYVAGGSAPAVCPNCGLRDIDPCPNCNTPVSRADYKPVAGDLFRCPACDAQVRLRFNDPLLNRDGEYNEPIVLVEQATEAAV